MKDMNLLPLARANGHKGVVRGLTAFVGHTEPIAAGRSRRRLVAPGRRIIIDTAGRELSYAEGARLLQFAADHIEP